MGDRFMKNIRANAVDRALKGVFDIYGSGGPKSGSDQRADSKPTGWGVCGYGSKYIDIVNGNEYFNEGTKTNLYWTPTSFFQPGLLGVRADFRDSLGKTLADTGASALVAGSGLRIFGQGIIETDSGVVVTQGANGAVARVTSSATATARPAVLGMGGATVPFDPITQGPLTIDAEFTVITDLLTKRVFLGFVGTAADALVSPITGAAVTLTLVQDDVSGMMFDSAMTAASRLYAPHNKADEAPTILASATGVDLGVNIAAVGTYNRLRVEISPLGAMTCFINKLQVTHIPASASQTVDLAPILLLSGTTAAIDVIDVKNVAMWGNRL